MIVNNFIHTNYHHIQPFEYIQHIKKQLVTQKALVIKEESKYIGTLTTADIIKSPYKMAVDCLTTKPSVRPQHNVTEALRLMEKEQLEVLPVQSEDHFFGLIYRQDIEESLLNRYRELEHFITRLLGSTADILNQIRSSIDPVRATILHLLKTLDKSPQQVRQEISKAIRKGHILSEQELKDFLDTVQNRSDYLVNLSGKLLEIKREEKKEYTQKYETTDLNQLLGPIIKDYENIAKAKGIRLIDERSKRKLSVKINTLDITQAIINLLSNAIKFTPSEGSITIITRTRNQKIQIQITDTGIGIPKVELPHIFDKFTLSKREGLDGERPNGLGLYIAKKIVKQHQGNITVQSREHEKTTFIIEFQKKLTNNPHSIND